MYINQAQLAAERQQENDMNLIKNAGISDEERQAANEARAKKAREWRSKEGQRMAEALEKLSEEDKELMDNSNYTGAWLR